MSSEEAEARTHIAHRETILKAAGIPLEASVHELSWNDEGNLEIEYTTDAELANAL